MLLFTGGTPVIRVIIVLCSLAIIARGAPTTYVCPRTNSTEATLVLPSIQRLTQHLRRLVPRDKSLFFSGPGDYEFKARLYAREHGLNVLVDFGDPIMAEMATDAGGDILKEYWYRLSVAYSEATSGTAYVLLPGEPEALGTTWYKGTIWDTVEWPVLQRSSAVTRILRINPSMTPAQGVNIKPTWTFPPGS